MPTSMPSSRPVFISDVPYDVERVHAAAVYCSDGRIGDQIDDFLHHGLGFQNYDRVTCPGGPVALTPDRFAAFWDARGIEEQIRFLTRVHDVRTIVLIAHAGCAYYSIRLGIPNDQIEAEQKADLRKASLTIRRLAPDVMIKRFLASPAGTGIGFEVV